jgi:hypothetical protein
MHYMQQRRGNTRSLADTVVWGCAILDLGLAQSKVGVRPLRSSVLADLGVSKLDRCSKDASSLAEVSVCVDAAARRCHSCFCRPVNFFHFDNIIRDCIVNLVVLCFVERILVEASGMTGLPCDRVTIDGRRSLPTFFI